MRHIKNIFTTVVGLCKRGAIMDSFLEFGDAFDISGTGTSSYYVKTLTNTEKFYDATHGAGVGRGTPLYINVTVNTAFAGNSASTIQIWLQTSADGSTWASGVMFAAMTASACATIGVSIVKAAIPAVDLAQYMQLIAVVPTGMSAGAVDAWIGLEAPTGPEDTTTYGWTS